MSEKRMPGSFLEIIHPFHYLNNIYPCTNFQCSILKWWVKLRRNEVPLRSRLSGETSPSPTFFFFFHLLFPRLKGWLLINPGHDFFMDLIQIVLFTGTNWELAISVTLWWHREMSLFGYKRGQNTQEQLKLASHSVTCISSVLTERTATKVISNI